MEKPFHPGCISIDLEVSKNDGRIHALGAVRGDTGEHLVHSGKGLASALTRLDNLADGASFVLGHNLIAFDLPHLTAAKPDLRLLNLPAVDTLRLSPLAFPRNPYHNLVKHYQDGKLKRIQVNDPELDARLTLQVFDEQRKALQEAQETSPDLLAAWHWLTTPHPTGADRALDDFFSGIRHSRRPSEVEARSAIARRLKGIVCVDQDREITAQAEKYGWSLAYTLAWLSVAGGNSVMPPWVRHQFPQAKNLVRLLRDIACDNSDCDWCRERHDARKELKRWFGFDDFRPEPSDDNGYPLQRAIVEEVMAGKHVLGILPTGTGKSLCYQIPALSRYDKTGTLTVVISPLVALMADQVAGMEKTGIGSCVTINGMLSMPERTNALDRVRLGEAGILIISPEQLRGRSLRRVLDQREIGAWVLDEAHCLSRWGHDFRPDYRYIGRFIREKARAQPIPPILCLTATAKPDVIEDIQQHFRDKLAANLTVFDGGMERDNLEFEVIPTSSDKKFHNIYKIFMERLPPTEPGGVIVYCATQKTSEEVAAYLQLKEVEADHYHAGLPPDTKKDVQGRFIDGEIRVIAATNAFGMGIDKPDVRLVIHANIPGSLENYLQEAGRAGRDRRLARCVLLYTPDDVERQFGMSARSRLTREEIHGILRALRNLDRKKRFAGEVVATAGEILGEDEDKAFNQDGTTDDTRVRTAVSWLEETELLTREENLVQIFPSSLRVSSVKEVEKKLEKTKLHESSRKQLLRIAKTLIEADADEGISTDELMAVSGLEPAGVRKALYDLERLGISNNDTALTAFIHVGVERSSIKRLQEAEALETALIAHMREIAPDQGKGDTSILHLRIAAQVLRDQGLSDPLPEHLWRIIRSIANDGRGEDGAAGSLTVRKRDAETVRVTLRREWQALDKTARLRREGARCLLEHLISRLPPGTRGTDLLAETTLGNLLQAIESDLVLKSSVKDTSRLLDRALLWLHELDVIRLNKGLAVFRPAMTIRLEEHSKRRGFSKADFQLLELHYQGKVLQIHVMVEFAERGAKTITEARRMAMDYFALPENKFLARWLPGKDQEVGRQTTPESWRAIVESLKNPVQQRIVSDEREQTNVLVLAGPGSGKTRVLVHRIACLIRARRQDARGILALAYNRHSAVDIRRRLVELIGDDARGVTVLTCHALAMRLTGFSFANRSESPDNQMFREVVRHAAGLLRGEGLLPEEADEQRERLLTGFRWILVDEYQDIGPDQYELISALAGRTLKDESGKLTLFAVGDDDQNIYAFNGASVEFIRRFETDYRSKPTYLTDNYRSTGHIVATSNAMIEPARERMKVGHPNRINHARAREPWGGSWEKLDPVSQGRVQILLAGQSPVSQAQSVMIEFQRLAGLDPGWDWSRCAVIAREWKYLDPVRAFCELHNIPSQMGNEEIPGFWRLRETRTLVEWLRGLKPAIIDSLTLRDWIKALPSGSWNDLLQQAIDEHELETDGAEIPVNHLIEWLAEWGREIRRRQRGLLLLTGHSAKGLEFDHVAVLDGGWSRIGTDEDPDAARRLYYVAMTRARQTLTLARLQDSHGLLEALSDNRSVIQRKPIELPPNPEALGYRYIRADLKNVDLGFAGRQGDHHPVHRSIAALSPGEALDIRIGNNGRWELLNRTGTVVGHLANNFKPPAGTRYRSAKVFAIIGWSRDATPLEYRENVKCDSWEVVVPELVFELDT